ncbi:MAG: Hemolysin-type calcium-binding region, partial [Proteobacteria bacterium]|nr:Hemolysin-type calcium-binding region [Pseudomonadota bacterium]
MESSFKSNRQPASGSRVAPLLWALEPRIMFDAAAITTAQVVADTHTQSVMPDVPAAVEVRAADPVKDNGKKEAALVDTSVADYKSLEAGVRDGVAIIEFDGSKDGLAQIAKWAATQSGYDAIHILSHGSMGELRLGSVTISADSLTNAATQAELAQLGQSLTADGDLLLYGCNVAQGTTGDDFVDLLVQATGADVAASDDATGAATLGGDWKLEVASGAVSTSALAVERFAGLLVDATFDFGTGADTPGASTQSYTNNGETVTFTVTNGTGKLYFLEDPGQSGGGGPLGNVDFANMSGRIMSTNIGDDLVNIVRITVTGKSFDLASFNFYDFMEAGSTITLTSNKGSTTFVASIGSTADSITLSANADFQGVNYVDVTSSAGGFLPMFDNVVLTNITVPATITSATYDGSTNVLTVTATGMTTGDTIDTTKLTLTGEGGATYTLAGTYTVTASSATSFSVTLGDADARNVEGLLNYDGTVSVTSTTYNIAGAADWDASRTTSADTTGNGVTVSNTQNPTITSATYDASTGVLTVTGSNMVAKPGATNDITISNLTLKGEGSATRTLTTSNVELTDSTSFSVTLNAADQAAINQFLNQTGTSSTGGTTYNLAASIGWNTNINDGNLQDFTNPVTVSNVAIPTIASASYNASTGALVVTGTGFLKLNGSPNDIIANKFTLTGEGGSTYTLTDTSSVEITSGTAFTLNLSTTDKAAVNLFMNKNGTSSTGGTTYNLAAAEDWAAGAAAAVPVADLTSNGITTSNVAVPTITSATYDAATGALVVTGTGFVNLAGSANDIDISKLSVSGDSTAYTLTSSSVDVTSATSFTVTLNSTDSAALTTRLNQNGTSSVGANIYNLAAAEDWAAGAAAAVTVADTTGNGITVSNFVNAPTVSVVVADNALSVGETSLVTFTFSEAVNGFDNSDLTVDGGTLSTVSSSDGGITWTATFTPTASLTDATNVITLDKTGVTSVSGSHVGVGTQNSNNYAIDTVRPTLASAITISDTALRVGDTATVTFTFTEAVTGFTVADLASQNATLSGLSSSDGGVTWTATLTPSASTAAASNVITLDYTGITDAAGNAGTGTATSGNYAVDTVRPTLASSITISDTALRIGDTAT